MKYVALLFIIIYAFIATAQETRKTASATRIETPPRVDGILNDPCWLMSQPIIDFEQFLPLFNTPPGYITEVKIVYDDQAVYIGAFMNDPYPDSIPMQLGNRDDENMNVDFFGIEFDTYNNQLDGYTFIVTSAGVQIDSRETDDTYDAVWWSEVKVTSEGWYAEMKIPYSAIRFPKLDRQQWGMQIMRYLRRYRELDFWALEKQGAGNDLVYWGLLEGIEQIEPPVRLSISPYLGYAVEHFPDPNYKDITSAFVSGMDLKYGLSESHTLDMTLLPDFSQVQSDNVVKNLSAFETVYEEQRPFFREAVDLFEKGDIFYSRRIGKTPMYYDSVKQLRDAGYTILTNPVQQRLLNATKLSGRGKKGLAIGLMNAITGNTWAEVEDAEHKTLKILTDPATNYNMVVLSQALKNNSEIFISNTNLMRGKGFKDANVTVGEIKMHDRKNTYEFNLNGAMSQVYPGKETGPESSKVTGYKWFAGIRKRNGKFQFALIKGAMSPDFDANDMGLVLYNNYNLNYGTFVYSIYQPFWKLRDFNAILRITNENNFRTGKVQKALLEYRSFTTTLNYLSLWMSAAIGLVETFDYYEPRIEGRAYISPREVSGNLGFSSDYRKRFALDGIFSLSSIKRDGTRGYGIDLHPIVRVNNHFMFEYILLLIHNKQVSL
jgi:hypothetical protein